MSEPSSNPENKEALQSEGISGPQTIECGPTEYLERFLAFLKTKPPNNLTERQAILNRWRINLGKLPDICVYLEEPQEWVDEFRDVLWGAILSAGVQVPVRQAFPHWPEATLAAAEEKMRRTVPDPNAWISTLALSKFIAFLETRLLPKSRQLDALAKAILSPESTPSAAPKAARRKVKRRYTRRPLTKAQADALDAYMRNNRNVAAAADELHISRPAAHDRITAALKKTGEKPLSKRATKSVCANALPTDDRDQASVETDRN